MKRLFLLALLLVAFAGLGWAQCNPTSCVIDGAPPDGFTGTSYSFQFTAHGGSGMGYTWIVSSNQQPPPGLTLNSQGLLSGTPTTLGSTTFQVQVRDSTGGTGSQFFTMNIFAGSGGGGIQITNPQTGNSNVTNAVVGQSYFFQFQASGGSGNYTWTGFVGVNGLSLNSFGQITGTPTGPTGNYQFNVRVTDSNNSTSFQDRTFFINVSGSSGGFQITTASVPNGVQNNSYFFQFTANGSGSYNWFISQGQLPPGLQFFNTGQVSGTPTTLGSYTFTVTVNDLQVTQQASRQFTMQVNTTGGGGFQITTASVPNGFQNNSYSFQFTANGSGSYNWFISQGQIPPGLQLFSGGQLSGVPTTIGSYTFTVTVTDTQVTQQASRQFTMQVNSTGGGFQITTTSVPSGIPGNSYSYQFTANGSGSYNWFISQGQLPPGLQLFTTGQLSGVPTTLGTYTFTTAVQDQQTQQQASRQFTMQINSTGSGTVRITTTAVPNAGIGIFYSFQFSATGCNTCFWTLISGSIPGLNFTSDGVLSGTPTAQGTFNFTVQVTDQSQFSFSNGSDQRAFTINVNTGRLDLIERTLPFGVQGQAYSFTVHATGGGPPYTYSLGSTDVTGLVIDSTLGTISGTPTNAGNFTFPITVTDATGNSFTLRYALFIATPLSILTTSLPNSAVGLTYNQTLQAGGGQAPFVWSVSSGTLPPGVTLDRTSGRISGTPTTNGRFNFTVQVLDAGNRTATKDFSVIIGTPLSVVTSSLADGAVGAQYSQTLTSDGGQTPVTWSLASGSTLPAGLTLSTGGVISGSPTAAGTSTFTVVATDANNTTAQKALSINVVNPVTITTTSTPDGTRGTAYQQGLGANGGTPPFTWSVTGNLPPGLVLTSINGVISGTPTGAGTFTFTVQVKDSAGQTATRDFTIRIIETLSISANDMSGAVGAAFNQSVSATGGSSPYTFSATGLPAGLSLNGSTGVITGTPTGAGTSSVTFTVTDSTRGTASKTVTIIIVAPPPVSIAPTVTSPTLPARQAPVTVTIPTSFNADITGVLSVNFITSVGRDDQSVRFTTGSRSVNYTIPAGATSASFTNAPGLALLTGTTAGAIVLTTTGTSGTNTRQITVDPGPPVLTRATDPLLQQGNGVVTVNFNGYSLTGELVSCRFVFNAATGSTLQANDFTVQMNPAFTTWMSNSGSLATGTNFFASVPFTLANGASSSIVGVSVSCNNARGTSNTLTN